MFLGKKKQQCNKILVCPLPPWLGNGAIRRPEGGRESAASGAHPRTPGKVPAAARCPASCAGAARLCQQKHLHWSGPERSSSQWGLGSEEAQEVITESQEAAHASLWVIWGGRSSWCTSQCYRRVDCRRGRRGRDCHLHRLRCCCGPTQGGAARRW